MYYVYSYSMFYTRINDSENKTGKYVDNIGATVSRGFTYKPFRLCDRGSQWCVFITIDKQLL